MTKSKNCDNCSELSSISNSEDNSSDNSSLSNSSKSSEGFSESSIEKIYKSERHPLPDQNHHVRPLRHINYHKHRPKVCIKRTNRNINKRCVTPQKMWKEESSKPKNNLLKDQYKLNKLLEKRKNKLIAVKDMLIMFEFLKNKIESSYPLFNLTHHQFKHQDPDKSRKWVEQFVERLICALTQKDVFKSIELKYRKLKILNNVRKYVLIISYKDDKDKNKKYKCYLELRWGKYSNTNSLFYRQVLYGLVSNINKIITDLKTESIKPFFE